MKRSREAMKGLAELLGIDVELLENTRSKEENEQQSHKEIVKMTHGELKGKIYAVRGRVYA